MDLQKNYTHELKSDKDGLRTVTVSVTPELFAEFKEKAYQELAKEVKISGFRPGKAPRAKVEAKIGNDLYSETIRRLLPEVAADIVEREELNPVTQLKYDIGKFSEAEGVEFSFEFTNYPEVKLPDIKKLSVEVDMNEEVSEEEVMDVIERLYTNEEMENAPQAEEKESKDDEKKEKKSKKEEKFDISKVTDEMVAKWDINGAKSVDELKKQIEERLADVKHEQAHRQLENKVLETTIEKAKFDIPAALLDAQTEELLKQYLARIDELDVERDTFLAAQGLDMKKLKDQKKDEAEKQISVDLVLNQVAKENDLVPTNEEIQAQIDAVTDEETKQKLDSFTGRRYILSTLLQAKAIEFLQENVTVKKPKKTEPKAKKPKKS